ncbi:cellulose biosynthesis protein BcsQ [Nitrospirillum sp. BR 11752]|uniref:cellulose biosynthesis protein BcsQ n=1 Tax=Nitrospirillum sp. BR 11752 TaxID=3104293 RepID=UPI002EBC6B0B|nr:cellulose biosynthesis protein BcsQ [Nitrospirillum sp. BR 11752]
MPLIVISSPKGGVGKTTLAGNLAFALAQAGEQVVALDFDPQNSLRLHFGLPINTPGFAQAPWTVAGRPQLSTHMVMGVRVLPFGHVPNIELPRLEARVLAGEGALAAECARMASGGAYVVVDQAPGVSVYLEEMRRAADLELVVLLADAVSLSLVPKIESGHFTTGRLPSSVAKRYVLNQVDPARRLNHDVASLLGSLLKDGIVGAIHRDECVAEAAAAQSPILSRKTASRAAADIADLASKVRALVPPPAASSPQAAPGFGRRALRWWTR